MFKKIYFSLLFTISLNSYGQEKIGEYNNNLKPKESINKILESFSIVNNFNKNIASFLLEEKNIYGYLLDSSFQVTKKLSSEDKRRKYRISLGKMFDKDNNYKVVVTDKKRKKFALIHFDFANNKVGVFEDEFNSNKLTFLQSVNRQDKIHLLFLNRMTSKIIARTYNIKGGITTATFDVNKEEFLIDDKRAISLSKLITDFSKQNSREIENIAYELTKINEDSYTRQLKGFFKNYIKKEISPPVSIETAVRINKLYINKDNIIITLDKNRFYTQILELNLNTGTHTFNKIKKPLFNTKKTNKRTNSFLVDNLLFAISSNKEKLAIDIINLENEVLVKHLEVIKHASIDFKNTPIMQQGASFDKYREFEESDKLLRKITDSNIGISARKNGNGYELTVGGIGQGLKSTQIIGAIALSTITGDPSSMELFQEGGFFNPYPKSFNDYSRKKSIRFKCLFDNSFNHIKGDVEKNSYDNIGIFLKNKETPKKTAVTIFPLNNHLILGAYIKKTRTYSFYKFLN